MTYETLLVSREGGTMVVQFNRPDRRNAFSGSMIRDLAAAVQAAADDKTVRAVIFTGGTEFFSAGADLKEINDPKLGPDAGRRNLQAIRSLTQAMQELGKPVIAAIEGFCLTGGFEFALACDIRIAGQGSSFGITSAKLGTLPGFGGVARLARAAGPAAAMEILFSADPISPEDAHRLGLLNHVAPRGHALKKALDMAAVYADRAPLSLAAMKQAVYRGLQMDLWTALDMELALGVPLSSSADRQEGARAFAEKRKPVFKGE